MRNVLLLGTLAAILSATISHPDVRTIVERSVAVSDQDWAAAPRFDFTEEDRVPTGTVRYQVMMVLGSPYYYRVAENGRPLPPDQARAEQQRLEEATARRHAESVQQRAARIAKYQRDRKRDHMLMSQLSRAFDFKFVREESMRPYRVSELKATPRAGYQPPSMETQALTGMAGTLWIDTKTLQWVKVEAHVVRPVAIEGFLARVERGTYFELEKAPVSDGTWQFEHFAMRARAKGCSFCSITGAQLTRLIPRTTCLSSALIARWRTNQGLERQLLAGTTGAAGNAALPWRLLSFTRPRRSCRPI